MSWVPDLCDEMEWLPTMPAYCYVEVECDFLIDEIHKTELVSELGSPRLKVYEAILAQYFYTETLILSFRVFETINV